MLQRPINRWVTCLMDEGDALFEKSEGAQPTDDKHLTIHSMRPGKIAIFCQWCAAHDRDAREEICFVPSEWERERHSVTTAIDGHWSTRAILQHVGCYPHPPPTHKSCSNNHPLCKILSRIIVARYQLVSDSLDASLPHQREATRSFSELALHDTARFHPCT